MTATGSATPSPTAGGLPVHYEFDEAFQTKIAALTVRDADFLARVEGLIRPEHFANWIEGSIVNEVVRFFATYHTTPALPTLIKLIKDAIAAKTIRAEIERDIKPVLRAILTADLTDRDYVIDQIAIFAKHQETAKAIIEAVGFLEKRNFAEIEKRMRAALELGINSNPDNYDLFAKIEERTQAREDKRLGKSAPTGITTGIPALDNLLYHKGWGRKELTYIMGGAKAGKTTALIDFGINARMAGFNVFYATLEVSKNIIADRADANITGTMMRELVDKGEDVKSLIEAARTVGGQFIIAEYPTGSLRPTDLRRTLRWYAERGTIFDLVVVDYADIMAPDNFMHDSIENSKQVAIGLRGIASEMNVALLTATQTNRDGFKAGLAKAEHIAEDFNKVRIADLVISINVTEDDRSRSEARLYFAASRNQATGTTITVKQDVERMKFIQRVLSIS